MSKVYTTVQGDMWDLIAYKVYGRESFMAQLIQVNDAISHIAVFPSGVEITCPTIETAKLAVLPPWRR